MKYKCLVLDHDDTVVDSTAQIHYPAFIEILEEMRPGVWMSLEDYFRFNFEPGFQEYCMETLHMTEEEMEHEVELWLKYVENHVPTVYPGMKEIILRHKAEGGIVCVVSHSHGFNILRDYEANGLPKPDMVFGWEYPPEQRKPHKYPLEQIMKEYGLETKDLIMVDDLKPGYDMAKACGVTFVGAGWCNEIPEIRDFMKQNSDIYLTKVSELEKLLFE